MRSEPNQQAGQRTDTASLFDRISQRGIVPHPGSVQKSAKSQTPKHLHSDAGNLHITIVPMESKSRHKVAIGARLRIALEALGLSQAEFCRQFDVRPSSKLGNWLRGDNYPDPWVMTQFCERYGVTLDWIYRAVLAGVAKGVGDAILRAGGEPASTFAGRTPSARSTKSPALKSEKTAP